MNIQASVRRTQQQRRDESDRRLLAAAAEIIATEGYVALTLERVGERAGYSRGLAARKYGSKDGLVVAVVRHVARHVRSRLDEAIRHQPSARAQIVTTLETIVELARHDTLVKAYFVMLSATVANGLSVRAAFREVHEDFAQRMTETVRSGQAAGEIPRGLDPQLAAEVMGSLQLGLAIEMALNPGINSQKICQTALQLAGLVSV